VERPGRRPVGEVNDGGECGIQVFYFGSGLKGQRQIGRGRGGGQTMIHSHMEGGGRRHRGGGYAGRRWRWLQLLGEEGEEVFSPLYVFGSGRRKARVRQRGGGLLGLEAEWACCYGGEIEEKEEWATLRTGLKVKKE
jgi:hypothetical protein